MPCSVTQPGKRLNYGEVVANELSDNIMGFMLNIVVSERVIKSTTGSDNLNGA